jgi:hypothetical protein
MAQASGSFFVRAALTQKVSGHEKSRSEERLFPASN